MKGRRMSANKNDGVIMGKGYTVHENYTKEAREDILMLR